MRRRIWAASILVVLAGCSSGSSSPPTTVATTAASTTNAATAGTAARTTVPNTTIPPTATTRSRASTSASPSTTGATTTEAPTSSSDVTLSPTTNVPAAPCDPAVLLKAAEAEFGPLPAGSVLNDPRCVENYASGVLTAPGQDTAFAVFDNNEGEWLGLNLGTDQICSGANVPLDFYGPLNCGPWEG